MSDDFLGGLKGEPRPGFARALRERLREQDEMRAARSARWRPVLGWATAMAVVALAFAFPAVRVSAQAMLDLFRVRNFAAVQFDPARFEKLKGFGGGDGPMFLEKQNTTQTPAPPRVVESLQAAGELAGLHAMSPTVMPAGLVPDTVRVTGGGESDFVVHTDRLRTALETLDLRDVQVPANLDGRTVHVRVSPMIVAAYVNENRRATVLQAKSPEVHVPAGVDLAQLGEIGLRVFGMPANDARRMARRIDWSSTMLVPVPMNAASFREVTVNGRRGLMITTRETNAEGRRTREGTLLLWSQDDRVLAVQGNIQPTDLVQMAESLR